MAIFVSGTELSGGGGGGLHTLVNTYDAAGVSADIDMDMDFSSYDKFRVLITDLYSSSASKIVFRCKNASNELNYLNSGSYSAMGRKHAAGSGGTEVHAITSFESEEAHKHNNYDFICSYENNSFQAYGKHLMELGGLTTSSVTYSTYEDFSYGDRLSTISNVNKLILYNYGITWTAGTIKIYGLG